MIVTVSDPPALRIALRIADHTETLQELIRGLVGATVVKIRSLEFESALGGQGYFWGCRLDISVFNGVEWVQRSYIFDAEGSEPVAIYMRSALSRYYPSDNVDLAVGQKFWTDEPLVRLDF